VTTKKKKTTKKTIKKAAKKKTKKKKVAAKMGAPTLYRPEYCQKILEVMGEGKSFKSFAAEIGVSSSACQEWANKYSEFRDSKTKAQDLYFKYWEDMGRRGSLGEIKNFNAAAWIFNMKNRFLWRNEIVVKDERKVESVTIELPQSKQAQTITLNEGDGWKESK
jgi:hypothetical protein